MKRILLSLSLVFTALTMWANNATINKVASSNIIAQGTSGTCVWTIDEDGNLIVSPTDGIEGNLWGSKPWEDYVAEIKTAKFIGNIYTLVYPSFDGCTNLTDIDFGNLDTSKATYIVYMFRDCSSLTKLDLSSLNTSQVTSMVGMFDGCTSLADIEFGNFDTSAVTSMQFMFRGCSSLTELDLSSFNTSKVRNMQSMFDWCTGIANLDLQNFDTSNVTNMESMFCFCSSLTSLDLSNFSTENVTSMHMMFDGCSNIEDINLSSFNTSNVTDMYGMFGHCKKLVSLDVSNFETSKVTTMYGMFSGCINLVNIDLSSFNTSNVTDMNSMFSYCSCLTELDLSNFNTQNVTNMRSMFTDCTKLVVLDLSSFDTSNVSSMFSMFGNCQSLETLILDYFDMQKVTNANYIFHIAKINKIIFKSIPYLKDGTFNNLQNTNFILDLTDASHIHVGENFYPTINTAKYTRTVSNKWGTIVLPFNAEIGSHYDFYEGTNSTLDALYLRKLTTLEAGTPAILRVDEGTTKICVTATDVEISTDLITTPAGDLTLEGSFTSLDLTDTEGYIISNNKFWNIQEIKGNSTVGIKPLRAYLAGSIPSGAKVLNIGGSEESSIDAINAISKGNAVFYDINGRRINDLQRGINIVKLANGKKKKIVVE